MNNAQRFYVLDAFRGIAAILVFLYHLPNLSALSDNQFIAHSGIFVDLFFVLSGFVIFHNYQHKITGLDTAGRFLKKRFKRLIPLHLFTLTVMVLLETTKYGLSNYISFNQAPFEVNTIATLWPQLFLVNSTPWFAGFNWNGQNWSISAELIAYLIFVAASFIWFKRESLKTLLSISIIALGYLFFFVKYNNFDIVSDFDYSFIRGTIGFFVGIICYMFRHKILISLNKISTSLYHVLEILMITITVCIVCKLNVLMVHFYVYHLVFAALILLFSMEKGWISQILKFKVFQNLGLWSYSIYLNHIFVIVLFNMIVVTVLKLEGNMALICEVITLIGLCLYSSATYKFVERRFYQPKTK